MRNRSIRFFVFLTCCGLFSCITESETKTETTLGEEATPEPETDTTIVQDTAYYPSYHVHSKTWGVELDVQEGFFLGFTLTSNNTTPRYIKCDSSYEIIGGMDYPDPYYVDSTTFYIPNVGGSAKGHFELYIHKDGSTEYVEITSQVND